MAEQQPVAPAGGAEVGISAAPQSVSVIEWTTRAVLDHVEPVRAECHDLAAVGPSNASSRRAPGHPATRRSPGRRLAPPVGWTTTLRSFAAPSSCALRSSRPRSNGSSSPAVKLVLVDERAAHARRASIRVKSSTARGVACWLSISRALRSSASARR